jgi:hypothetical protein
MVKPEKAYTFGNSATESVIECYEPTNDQCDTRSPILGTDLGTRHKNFNMDNVWYNQFILRQVAG